MTKIIFTFEVEMEENTGSFSSEIQGGNISITGEASSHILTIMTYLYARFIIWLMFAPVGGDIGKFFKGVPKQELPEVIQQTMGEVKPLLNTVGMQLAKDTIKIIKKEAGV